MKNFDKRVHYQDPSAVNTCKQAIELTLTQFTSYKEIIFICIGTDRSTGDSLGPIVGTLLAKRSVDHCTIYGTLSDPVHALNLPQTLKHVQKHHPHALIIAVDACLGKSKSIGQIQVGLGPIKPGAAVNKSLPEVGQIHITGIVNMSGYMEFFVLQNTRLNIVMQMAEVISHSLHSALSELTREGSLV